MRWCPLGGALAALFVLQNAWSLGAINAAIAAEHAAGDDSEPANKDHFYIEVLHRALAESDKLNMSMAMSAAVRFSNGSAYLQRKLLDRNVIHHVLDMYRLSRDNGERAALVEVLKVVINKGARMQEEDDEEPDAVIKSLYLREMVLAEALVTTAQLPFTVTSNLVRLLYMVTCDTVPLAKLLLHAHTIVASVVATKGDFPNGVDGVRRFVNSASLQPGAKPAVKGADLATLSTTFNGVLARLGTQDMQDRGIQLADIVDALDEATNGVHSAFLGAASPARQVTPAMLAEIDEFGRNALHVLCLSGARRMLAALADQFTDPSSPSAAAFVKALTAPDVRGQSPIAYLVARFGALPQRATSADAETASRNAELMALIDQLKALFQAAGEPTSPFDRPTTTTSTSAVASAGEADTDANTGGWNTTTVHASLAGDSRRCDVAELFSADYLGAGAGEGVAGEYASAPFGGFTGERFLKEFVATGTPVILRGAALRSPIRDAFARAQLLEEHGGETVPFATLPYAGSFGVAAYRVPLSKVASLPPPPTVALSRDEALHHLTIMREAALAQRNATGGAAVGIDGEATAVPLVADASAKAPVAEEPPLYAFTTLSPAFRKALNAAAPLPPFLTEVLFAHAVAAGDLKEAPPDPDDAQFLSPAQVRNKQLRRALADTDHFASHVETQFYLGPEVSMCAHRPAY